MKSIINILTLVIILSVFHSCAKDENEDDGWQYCFDCRASNWTGNYSGTGSYYDAVSNSTFGGKNVNITIDETGDDYFTVYLSIPTLYNGSISGTFYNGYSFSCAGTKKTFSANLYRRGNEMKLSGNYKTYTSTSRDDDPELKEVINFEVYKNTK